MLRATVKETVNIQTMPKLLLCGKQNYKIKYKPGLTCNGF